MATAKKYICIHGHFYQPPRENPWLEEVEWQDSAYPFHDWNERISSECYARNAASRILNSQRQITYIVNNYSQISFNFGPTLLSWMVQKDPETYQAILDADRLSLKKFSGHGAALAQPYNHMIMPLANSRDKRTQILWGIKDFECRFKRKPEGMWLPETAVDLETLDILAEEGIKFTILGPHQAKRVRKMGDHHRWRSVTEHKLDCKIPYLCRLPSGRVINIFFYDGPVSRAVAFEGLLNNGEDFASRLINAFDHQSESSQLIHIATDGETYGHHHKFGDMALAYCLHFIEKNKLVDITIYGEYLEKHPAEYEVEIMEATSWSCAHGVERWRSNCGCRIGGIHQDWTQEWRAPLREALDWLRDEMMPLYVQYIQDFHISPWSIRDAYIDVILDRSVDNVNKFLMTFGQREFAEVDRIRLLKLLEMQRNAQLMYTSCGWFFDEISGIEAVQILKYAARAIQLTKEVCGQDLEGRFLTILEKAKSNIPAYRDGASVYRMFVKPAVVDLLTVGAHFAFASLFEEFPPETSMYCFTIYGDQGEVKESGRMRLAIGRGVVQSNITGEKAPFSFAVLHLGDHNLVGGVETALNQENFFAMYQAILSVFVESNIPEVINLINTYFTSHNYSLWRLFKFEQQKILHHVLQSVTEEIESSFRQIYENYYPLMQIKDDIRLPLPKTLVAVVEFVLNRDITQVLEKEEIDIERLQSLSAELKRWSFERDRASLGFVASRKVSDLMVKFSRNASDVLLLEKIVVILMELSSLNLTLDFWKAQNIYFAIGKSVYPEKKKQIEQDSLFQRWVAAFERLGQILEVKID